MIVIEYFERTDILIKRKKKDRKYVERIRTYLFVVYVLNACMYATRGGRET